MAAEYSFGNWMGHCIEASVILNLSILVALGMRESPTLETPGSFCESPIAGNFPKLYEDKDATGLDSWLSTAGGLVITGEVLPGTYGVRLQYQRIDGNLHGPVNQSDILPLDNERFTARLPHNTLQVRVVGVTAITALEPGNQNSSRCYEVPNIAAADGPYVKADWFTAIPDLIN